MDKTLPLFSQFGLIASLKSVLFIHFILIGISGNTQNLVPNGGFEEYDELPNDASQWHLCKGWTNVNLHINQTGVATPDYFHANSTGMVQTPNTWPAHVFPFEGKAIMGFIALHPHYDWREYISTELSEPLTVGLKYSVSFQITNGESNHHHALACNGIGLQLTTSPYYQSTYEPIQIMDSSFIVDTIISEYFWRKISFEFIAKEKFKFITLGSFYDEDSLSLEPIDTMASNQGGYYFIDDVRLECIDEACQFKPFSPSIHVPNVFTPNNDSINDKFKLVDYKDFIEFKVDVFNRWGETVYSSEKLSFEWQGKYNYKECPEGVYLWKISGTTIDGANVLESGFVHLIRN